jgi:UDP-N-acetylglucosamine--N-acetylmuramyl-(pentapeptide) pyrophosphoryl-undecaprenol N-acetylglucosamine transferase
LRIIVSGGGTGGHISPVLAVINELKKYDGSVEILYIGSEEGLESKIIPQTGISFRAIPCGKFRRYHRNKILNIIDPTTIITNVRDLFRFWKGYREAKKIIFEYDPDVVFTKGGYVSLPVGRSAISLGYPLVIHESDSIIGLSNKMLAKKAAAVCVAYPSEVYSEEKLDNLIYTGNPVREDIYEGKKDLAIKEFNLDKTLPTIMVVGGSQGALVVNQLISETLSELLKKYQIIHISGERDYDWLEYKSKTLEADLLNKYHLYNYLSGNLKNALAAADLVISRAGNNFIAELAALAKPTILIPLTTSANNHQAINAQILAQQGAALMMLQEHLTPKKIIRQIDLLFESPEDMVSLSEHIKEFAKTDAAETVAKEIIKVAKEFLENDKEEKE